MNDKIRTHMQSYCAKNGWGQDDETIHEVLMETSPVWIGNEDDRRWWRDYTKVVNIDGMLIGLDMAETTGDESARDKGWEFDPKSIKEYTFTEKTVVIKEYKPVE